MCEFSNIINVCIHTRARARAHTHTHTHTHTQTCIYLLIIFNIMYDISKNSILYIMPYFQCNKCRCIVDEDHVCDYDNTDNTLENNNNISTGHNYECDFTEKLISEVFTREPLWNSKLPYKQRGPRDIKSLWSEIDVCLGKINIIKLSFYSIYCKRISKYIM